MSISTDEIRKLLKEIGFKEEEIDAYLFILKNKEFDSKTLSEHLNIDENKSMEIINDFKKKSLIIEGANKKYKCLHPRMGLTNVYKSWEESMIVAMRRRRAMIELLVRNLSPIYEQ